MLSSPSGATLGDATGAALIGASDQPVAATPQIRLPDLVVDNLKDDNKVNLRNYGAGDKPVLIWLWAPN